FFLFSSRRRHTRSKRDWSSDVCSSDLDFIEKQFEPDGFLGLWGTSKINTSRIIPVQHLNNLGIVYVRNLKEKQSIAFSAEFKNVFNEEIYNEFKMQSPGRNFRMKITYSF